MENPWKTHGTSGRFFPSLDLPLGAYWAEDRVIFKVDVPANRPWAQWKPVNDLSNLVEK